MFEMTYRHEKVYRTPWTVIRHQYRFFMDNKILFVPFLFVTFGFLWMLTLLKGLFFIALLVIAGSFSTIYNRAITLSLGVELIMLGTVLTSITYGPMLGIFVAISSLIGAAIVSHRVNSRVLVSMLGLTFVAIFSYSLNGAMSLPMIGMLMVVLFNAIIMPINLLMGSPAIKCVIFSLTHVIFNYWIFTVVAPVLYAMMV